MKKFLLRLALVTTLLASALLAPLAIGNGSEGFCETCYTDDMCIPVHEDFGYRECTPNVTKYFLVPDIVNGGYIPIPYLTCEEKDRCLLAPQTGN